MHAEQTCPYCNAVVPLPAGARPGELIVCPRCEERFQLRNVASGVASAPRDSSRGADATPLAGTPRFSNRTIGFMIVGVMLFMASVALVFALNTEAFRRSNDLGLRQSRSLKRPRQPDIADAVKVMPYAPLQTPALALLPSDMDVLAGVHLRAVLQEREGQRLLEREVPGLRGSVQSRLLNRVEALTGIKAEEIDHVVTGLRLRDTAIVVAVKTRDTHPYIAERVVKKLRAEPHPGVRGWYVCHFRQEFLPTHSDGLLNCLDERTLLLAWQADLKDVMPKGDGKPKAELTSLIEERVKPAGPVWVVGSVDETQAQGLAQLLKFAGSGAEAEYRAWLSVRAAALWLTLDSRVTIHAVARSGDVAKREALEKWLRDRLGDKKDVALFPDRDWLSLQYRPAD